MCPLNNIAEDSKQTPPPSKFIIWLRQLRAPFFTASIVPVLVGSTLGFIVSQAFDWPLFIMALSSIVCLHAGANIANDYFDHTSGNDWLNKNYNPFSGGSRLIQDGLLTSRSVLIASLLFFALAALIGIVILYLTRSVFILALGITGILGGYFYTASPVRLSYRGVGEIVIAFLFGILPVYGSYFLQTRTIDILPLAPALIIADLIFLIILINEFPDHAADAAANKKTLVVLLGPERAVNIYSIALSITYLTAILAAIFQPPIRLGSLLYLLTLPIALAALKFLKTDALNAGGKLRPNKFTIILHLAAGLALSAGFIITNQAASV
jgi:1,4-dihydroxy-2-naphthoate octaprenyltransferase